MTRWATTWTMALLWACGQDPQDTTGHPEPLVEDGDQDGFTSASDCDDADPDVHPDALDLCNGLDDDCSGAADDDPSAWASGFADADGDGFGHGPEVAGCAPVASSDDDCDDADAAVHPDAPERCDGVDSDCDPGTVERAELGGVGYETLQDAVDAAVDGDTVVLCDGIFDEQATVGEDIRITSKSGSAASTRLDGGLTHPLIEVVRGAEVELVGLAFANGRHDGDGGAVDATLGGTLTVTDCVFEANEAWNGGAIAAWLLVVSGSTFQGNVAADEGRGGAIDVAGDFSVSTSTFTGNRAHDGGAIHASGLAFAMTDCALDANVAVGDGGAVLARELALVRSTFTGNVADEGGAVQLVGNGDSTADADTLFEGNSAGWGGAFEISLPSGQASWTGGTFRGNHAATRGGAIAASANDDVAPPAAVTLADLVVEGNDATFGGGLSMSGRVHLATSSVVGNIASTGGGIFFQNGESSLVEVTITDNAAAGGGGGLTLQSGFAVLEACVVLRNTGFFAGGAEVDYTADGLSSVSSDFGVDADENLPSDVDVSFVTYAFGAAATFSCVGLTGDCS